MNIGELIASIGADTSDFEKGMARVEGRMKSAGKSMQKAGRQMSMAVTAPLLAIGGLGLKTAADFEAAMNQVKAVSGATGEQFGRLEELARDLGATTKFSATEAADGMGFLAMAGFEVDEIMTALPSTLDLAAAGNMELAESADIVSNVMQGFGLEASKTGETVDILTKAFTSSNTSLGQLGEAMAYAAPIANTYGQSIEEATAAVGILSDAGVQASRAGTSLRQFFIQIQKKAGDLGISIRDDNDELKSMTEILEALESTGMDATEMIGLLGARAGSGTAILLQRGSEGLKEFTGELENAGGTAKRVADTQMEGLKGAMTELRSAMSEVAISFSSVFQGSIEKLVDSITGLMRWLGDLDEKTKTLILTIAGIAAAIGPVLVVLGTLSATVIPALISGFAMLISPVGLVLAGITALGIASMGLVNELDPLSDAMNTAKDAVSKASAEYSINKSRVDNLVTSLDKLNKKANLSTIETQAKKDIIEELNGKYGEYFENQVTEKTNLEELRDIQEQVNDGLRENILMKAKQSATEEILNAKIDKQREAYQKLNTLLKDAGVESISKRAELIGGAFEAGLEGESELFKVIKENTSTLSSGWSQAVKYVGNYEKASIEAEKATRFLNTEINILAGLQDKAAMTTSAFAEQTRRASMSTSAFEEQSRRAQKAIEDATDAKEDDAKKSEDSIGAYSELQSALSKTEDKIKNILAAGNPIPPELKAAAEAYRSKIKDINEEFDKLGQQKPKIVYPEIPDFQLDNDFFTVDIVTDVDDSGLDVLEKYVKGVGLVGQEWDRLSAQVQANVKRILQDQNILVNGTKEQAIEMAVSWDNTKNAINQAIESAAESVVINSAKMIGAMIAGEGSFKNFGNMILMQLGGLAVEIGKLLIQFGIAFKTLKTWALANPGLAIAAGVALVAMGSAISGAISSKMENAGESPGNLQGLATGGQVTQSGTFWVGEEGPELATLPRGSAVTPNHAIGSNQIGDYDERLITEFGIDKIAVMLDRHKRKSGRIS